MCPKNNKRQERETRQQERKTREKKAHGKEDEDDAKLFNNQLRAFNLQLRYIIGDGNCLFRSFADQIDGDQNRHGFYRKQICNYMKENHEHFEPFIVDQTFDSFIHSLSKDGTYGGNESIVAFSHLFDAKICIHQLNQPVWTVCFSDSPKHEIHISYHNYEHYSSVRKLGDHTPTSANIRQSMTTCDPSNMNEKTKKTTSAAAATTYDPSELFTEHDIDYILSQLTNPVDPQLIRDTLIDNHGDIDQTITYLLTIDTPVSPAPPPPTTTTITTSDQSANDSIEKIMSTTEIYDVDLVQQSYATNNCDLVSTVESLLKLTVNEEEKEEEEVSEHESIGKSTKSKNRPVLNRKLKNDKKKAKKERATERRRAQIVEASSKKSDEKPDSSTNQEQEPIIPVNMEFINI